MVTVEFPAAEAAAGGQSAGRVGQFIWQVTQVVEAHDPRVPGSGDKVPNLAWNASQRSRAGIYQGADNPARGRFARSLLALRDQDRAGQARTQGRDQKGSD